MNLKPSIRRNPANVQPLVDHMVMLYFDDDPKIGDLGLFPEGWVSGGVLVDDSNIDMQRTIGETNVAGAGFGIISRAYKPGELSMTYETLEDSATNRKIAWPDTVEKNGVEILRNTARMAQAYVATVREQQDGIVSIEVTRRKANLKMENVGRGMSVEGKQVSVGLIPGPDKDVLERVWFKVEKDGTAVQLDPKIFVEQSQISKSGETYQAGDGTPKKLDEVGASEVAQDKTVTLPSGVTSGTWTLTVGSKTTDALRYNATGVEVQQALQTAGVSGVTVTGFAKGSYTVKGAKGVVTADGASLDGGTSKKITVS